MNVYYTYITILIIKNKKLVFLNFAFFFTTDNADAYNKIVHPKNVNNFIIMTIIQILNKKFTIVILLMIIVDDCDSTTI